MPFFSVPAQSFLPHRLSLKDGSLQMLSSRFFLTSILWFVARSFSKSSERKGSDVSFRSLLTETWHSIKGRFYPSLPSPNPVCPRRWKDFKHTLSHSRFWESQSPLWNDESQTHLDREEQTQYFAYTFKLFSHFSDTLFRPRLRTSILTSDSQRLGALGGASDLWAARFKFCTTLPPTLRHTLSTTNWKHFVKQETDPTCVLSLALFKENNSFRWFSSSMLKSFSYKGELL